MTETIKKPTPNAIPTPSPRLTKLKTAFLYVLIGGLAASAIISVVALLMGHFSSVLLKALLTIFVFFTHALFILAILWADRYNQVGKLLLPTALLILAFSNLITTTLGTWEVISGATAWRALGLYFLIIGAVFVITGILKLRIVHQTTQIALYTTIGLIAATVATLAPWVLQIVVNFDPLYFRIVAALSILTTASFLISLILRGIALGHTPALKTTAPVSQPIPGGLLAIYIVVGVLTSFVWMGGFVGFVASGVEASTSHYYTDSNRYY